MGIGTWAQNTMKNIYSNFMINGQGLAMPNVYR